MIRPLATLIALSFVAACAGDGKRVEVRGEAAAGSSALGAPDPALGTWQFTRFEGGPPQPGDIFEKVEVDFASGRVRVVHILTDDATQTTCEVDMEDSSSLRAVAAGAGSSLIWSAFTHPEELRIPPDAANVTAAHDEKVIAAETSPFGNESAEKSALRALCGAVAKLVAEALRDPACAAVRR